MPFFVFFLYEVRINWAIKASVSKLLAYQIPNLFKIFTAKLPKRIKIFFKYNIISCAREKREKEYTGDRNIHYILRL